MTETPSQTDANLMLLEGEAAFAKHASLLVQESSRELLLLSQDLDLLLFGSDDFVTQVSALARRDRQSNIKILLADIRPAIDAGHPLLYLVRRLSSKIHIRKLLLEPESAPANYLIGDRQRLLLRRDLATYSGFVSYRAAPESRRLVEEFTWLWESHSEESAEFRTLVI